MSPLSIVAISCFSVLFLLLLLSAAAALVYTQLLLRRQITDFILILKGVESKIDSNYVRMEALVGTINGQKITEAVNQFLTQIPRQAQIASRNEQAALLIIDLVKHLAGEAEISGSALDRARASGLGPEDYSPHAPDEHFVTRTRTSASDAEALAEESATNTQSFNDD